MEELDGGRLVHWSICLVSHLILRCELGSIIKR